jgi:hypothetical protein
MNITKYDLTCLDWTFAAKVDATIARQFTVGAKSARFCFDPNTLTAGADAAEVLLLLCHDGSVPAANPEYECIALTNDPMTGIVGAPGTQDSCIQIGPGAYTIIQSVDPGDGDTPRVTIQGEGD